ncbi:GFA family protein [Polymorphobacter sp.]|uniref:GFA family protein n=1 Tax=Polymorphobacter sp. TaxID=1909290 RepID=UPI003F70D610
MAPTLEGSCRCGAVRFSVKSRGPVPFLRCYCSICRKTAGGGGYAINLHAERSTLTVQGETSVYRAALDDGEGGCRTSSGERHFCAACASALWVFSPDYPDLVHPFASAVDSELPVPPARVHMMLGSRGNWVVVESGPGDRMFDGYADQTLEEWHRAQGLWEAPA